MVFSVRSGQRWLYLQVLLLDGKLTLFIFFVYIYAFVFVSLNECFTSSLFLFYKLSRKYVIQTREHVKQRQKIPILSVNFWLWLLSWKYKLKTCGKMYFKKLVRLQILYIHKFLFYVILNYVTGSIYGGLQFFSSPVMVRGLAICMLVTPHCLRFLHMIVDFGEV